MDDKPRQNIVYVSDVSRARSSSLPTRVKDVVTRAVDDASGALTILKHRLLQCTPFRGLPEDKVRDVRKNAPKPREKDCPERPFLLNGLAGALLFWESAQASAPYMHSLNTDLDQLVAILQNRASVWSQLPDLGIRFGGQNSTHCAILRTIRDLTQQWRQWPLEYDAHVSQRLPGAPLFDARGLTTHTVQMMATDFRAFGPAKGEFPKEAIYHALAAILEPFGVRNIHGNTWTAAGIQKLLRRHPPWRDLYPRDDWKNWDWDN
jgi:hypothetical protein